MPRLQSRPFATPDEVRTFPHGRGEVVKLDESVVGRATYEPGWRWTTDMPAVAGTATCQLHHLGYSISGLMHVVTDEGHELDILPESIYEIPSGHDAWVVGDEPWVTLEWTSARSFGVSPEGPGERILATVLFTDIVDSTATMERIGDAAWRDVLGLTTVSCARTSTSSADARSPRPGTASWRCSTAPRGPFAVASR